MELERAEKQGDRPSLLARARVEIQGPDILPSLTAGIIMGIIAVTVSTAFAALLFSGDLSPFLPAGVGLMIFGSVAVSALVALFSSFPGVVGGLQDSAIAILSLATLSILQNMPPTATPEQKFYTVTATIALSSLLTGATLLLLGRFRLGELIRYIPYPVVGGFLAGSGLLLVLGGFGLLVNQNITIWRLNLLLEPELFWSWLPGLAYAILLVVLLRRYHHPLLMPASLAGAVLVIYGGIWLSGSSIEQAAAQGWLLGSEMDRAGGLWQPLGQDGLAQVNWPAVVGQAGNLAAVVVVSVITLLLNATGLELVTGRDLDLNRELRAAGIANLAAGLGGALGGTQTIGDSTLAYKMGARSKLVGLSLALFCGIVLLLGGAILAFFPRLVLGGLLVYLGLDFLYTWVYEAWFKLSLADYLTVFSIMVVINTAGLLQGMGLGLVLAVALFVINYSRLEVVKYALTGRDFQSQVERPRIHQQLLREHGEWIYILKLQGFLFFGTANKLFERVRQQLNQPGQITPRFIVLDFGQVSGLDASAVLSFLKMLQLAQSRHVVLLFTRLSSVLESQLRKEALRDELNGVWHIEADLNHGVEWCEEQVIRQAGGLDYLRPLQSLKQQLEELLPEPGRGRSLMEFVLARNEQRLDDPSSFSLWFPRLAGYLEYQEVKPGECLISQGEGSTGLYFVENGHFAEQIEICGRSVRTRNIGAGSLIGEVGFYTGWPETSTVVALGPGEVYKLSEEQLKYMEADDPQIAVAFHKFIAQILSERLVNTKYTLQVFINQ